MVASVPVKLLLAQDSKSWFEIKWEHDEEESLSTLPADLKEDLLKVKEVDLEHYGELLHDAAHTNFDGHFGYMEVFEKERYETDVLVQQLELQTEALGIQFEHANVNQKNGLNTKLITTLEKLFEMKEKDCSLNIQMLEEELAGLKESLSVRQKHKKEIINRRLNELIVRNDKLDNVEDQIISLQTKDLDIYIVKKNSKEEWYNAIKTIQKRIRNIRKEALNTSM